MSKNKIKKDDDLGAKIAKMLRASSKFFSEK